MLPPIPSYNIILFQLDFNVKFSMLRLLQLLSDLRSTILNKKNFPLKMDFEIFDNCYDYFYSVPLIS